VSGYEIGPWFGHLGLLIAFERSILCASTSVVLRPELDPVVLAR
jgi:hypothetical protein